jgi:hypothetical protein
MVFSCAGDEFNSLPRATMAELADEVVWRKKLWSRLLSTAPFKKPNPTSF